MQENSFWCRGYLKLCSLVFFNGYTTLQLPAVLLLMLCQARCSYYATDMRTNERFSTLYMMYKGNKLGLDFTEFDNTVSLGEVLCIWESESTTTVNAELPGRCPWAPSLA